MDSTKILKLIKALDAKLTTVEERPPGYALNRVVDSNGGKVVITPELSHVLGLITRISVVGKSVPDGHIAIYTCLEQFGGDFHVLRTGDSILTWSEADRGGACNFVPYGEIPFIKVDSLHEAMDLLPEVGHVDSARLRDVVGRSWTRADGTDVPDEYMAVLDNIQERMDINPLRLEGDVITFTMIGGDIITSMSVSSSIYTGYTKYVYSREDDVSDGTSISVEPSEDGYIVKINDASE